MTAATGVGGFLRGRMQGPLNAVGGFFQMCVLTAKATTKWPFEWR